MTSLTIVSPNSVSLLHHPNLFVAFLADSGLLFCVLLCFVNVLECSMAMRVLYLRRDQRCSRVHQEHHYKRTSQLPSTLLSFLILSNVLSTPSAVRLPFVWLRTRLASSPLPLFQLSNHFYVRTCSFFCIVITDKQIRFLQYSDQEYLQFLQHPDWTKQETDTLFDLCRRFDLRFIVIADQFNPIDEQTNEYKGMLSIDIIASA